MPKVTTRKLKNAENVVTASKDVGNTSTIVKDNNSSLYVSPSSKNMANKRQEPIQRRILPDRRAKNIQSKQSPLKSPVPTRLTVLKRSSIPTPIRPSSNTSLRKAEDILDGIGISKTPKIKATTSREKTKLKISAEESPLVKKSSSRTKPVLSPIESVKAQLNSSIPVMKVYSPKPAVAIKDEVKAPAVRATRSTRAQTRIMNTLQHEPQKSSTPVQKTVSAVPKLMTTVEETVKKPITRVAEKRKKQTQKVAVENSSDNVENKEIPAKKPTRTVRSRKEVEAKIPLPSTPTPKPSTSTENKVKEAIKVVEETQTEVAVVEKKQRRVARKKDDEPSTAAAAMKKTQVKLTLDVSKVATKSRAVKKSSPKVKEVKSVKKNIKQHKTEHLKSPKTDFNSNPLSEVDMPDFSNNENLNNLFSTQEMDPPIKSKEIPRTPIATQRNSIQFVIDEPEQVAVKPRYSRVYHSPKRSLTMDTSDTAENAKTDQLTTEVPEINQQPARSPPILSSYAKTLAENARVYQVKPLPIAHYRYESNENLAASTSKSQNNSKLNPISKLAKRRHPPIFKSNNSLNDSNAENNQPLDYVAPNYGIKQMKVQRSPLKNLPLPELPQGEASGISVFNVTLDQSVNEVEIVGSIKSQESTMSTSTPLTKSLSRLMFDDQLVKKEEKRQRQSPKSSNFQRSPVVVRRRYK